MSDFGGPSDIISALTLAGNGGSGCRQEFAKTTITTVAAFDYSLWLAGGAPIAGVAPTTWAHPTQATAGSWCPKYVNASGGQTNRALLMDCAQSISGQVLTFRDRLGHMGGLSGTSLSAQTVNATLTAAANDGRCNANGTDVEWFLEWYSATGSTGINVTLAVTYSDNSTGNVVVAIPASVPASRMYRIQPASATPGLTIKAISIATNSASTGTAGNYGVTATKKLFTAFSSIAGFSDIRDWAKIGIPQVGSNACIFGTILPTGTSSGSVIGTVIFGGH